MSQFKGMRRVAQLLVLAGLAGGGLANANSGAVTPQDVVIVEQGTHQLIREKLSVKRVAVGDQSIADVTVVNRRELLVTGKTQGVTSLLVWYQDLQQTRAYRLVVQPVRNPLDAQAEPDPALAGARVQSGQLAGSLPDLSAHRRAMHQAGEAAVDHSTVDIATQVLTEIKIAELSRTTLKQFGFNFLLNRLDGTVSVTRPGTLGGATLNAPQTTADAPANSVSLSSASGFLPLSNAFNIVLGNATRNILGYLSLLENQGLVRTLAEPSLTATTGQTATFLAGGEFPVPVSQGGNNGISIEFKEFGIRLSLTPTVLAANRVSLKVAPEVSELDFSAGVQVGGTAVPALNVRRTDTTVELGDGESFVISGLISRNLLANVDKIPFLGSVPVFGAFFKSSRYSREERELIMVVTPHLVKPLRPDATTPALPGAEYDDYRPGAADLIFIESGKFRSGYSR